MLQVVLDALPPIIDEGRQGGDLLADLLHGAVTGWQLLALRHSFNGLHDRVQLTGDLRRRLGRRVGDAERMQGERECLQVVAIRALHLGPLLDLGLSRRHQCLGLWRVRSRVRLFLEAGEGLRGLRERLLCLSHVPANGQRIALDDVMDNMEEIRHAQALQPLLGQLD